MTLLAQYPQLTTIRNLAKRKRLEIYLVGGFLRDYLLRRSCCDFDFAVSRDAIPLARAFAKKIHGAFVLLDEAHGCARVAKKSGQEIWTFDFADFRAATLAQDLQHRDFTINTFCLDLNELETTTIVDDVLLDKRQGGKDLKAGKIRMVSAKSFKEDPLRLLRAFSLRAMLDFSIELKTLRQIKKDRALIRQVSYERIRDEAFKILESPRAADAIKAMDRIGLLEEVIPHVTVMYDVKQGTYHHLDVWPHSVETVVQMEKVFTGMSSDADVAAYLQEPLGGQRTRRAVMKLAALLHDIGKPETRKQEPGRISFHAHEQVGKRIVRHVAKLLKISTHERLALETMVLWHLRPGYLSNFRKPSDKSVFRYFRDTKDEAASIALLSLADQRSTRGPLTTEEDQQHHEKICLGLVQKFFEKKKEKPFVRLINGNDLIRKLKLKPSPLFSKILSAVEEAQATGKITTQDEALELAKKVSGGG